MLGYVGNNGGGLNYSSPTVQNFMNPPVNPYYIPPQNIGNIGGLGYNSNLGFGGYYSGNYQYYDPSEIRRMEEERQKAEKEAIDNYIKTNVQMNKVYCKYNGLDQVTDEYLEKYYNPNTYAHIIQEFNDYSEMGRLATISMNYVPTRNIYVQSKMEEVFNKNTAKHPVDESFQHFMDTAGEEVMEIMQNEVVREMRKNIRNRYDSESFNQLTNLHRSSFASLRENVSVDDMTVQLPPHLRNSYQERKAAFLAHLMADPRNSG